MSLIATLFTKSCADGALVAAGGIWARATEANRPKPTVSSSVLFMMCTPGSACGSRAAQLTNLAAPFWFRSDLGVIRSGEEGEVVQAAGMRPWNAVHRTAASRSCTHGRAEGVSSIGQCNTSCSLLAGVSKAKVFRGR